MVDISRFRMVVNRNPEGNTMAQVRDQARTERHDDQVAESAGILLRVSSDGQDETNQRPELDAWCAEQGYRVNRTYQLHDRSAFHAEHEDVLAGILEDIRAGVIRVLVIVHSSRIDRRDPDVAAYYHLSIRLAGGRIESVREPLFGKSDLAGQITTMMAQHSNHEYSRTLAGHIAAGHNRIRENQATEGTGLFGRAPYGYRITGPEYGKDLTPDDVLAPIVAKMFQLIVDGQSLQQVADWLNAEHVPTGTRFARDKHHKKIDGKLPKWHASTVRHVIRNTVYKGQMRDSDGGFVRKCQRIVSAALWRKANDRLDSAPTRRRSPADPTLRAMLASAVTCGLCGSAVYRSTSETRVYYRCAGKTNGTSCFMVRLAKVDAAVDGFMSGNRLPVMKMTLVPGTDYTDEIDLVKAQIRALDPESDGYEARHGELMAELARLRTLDTTPDKWEPRPTGETWGQLWDGLQPYERGEWLVSQGFVVTLTPAAVTVVQGRVSRTLPL
jgi:DNA invertase Pin-like site-specific DNA recombinase